MPASSAALVILCLAAVCGTEHNTVYLHHGSGRLAARMTPYTLLLVLREKHGLQVMVDRGVADAVSKYFTLPRRLAVIEDELSEVEVTRLREQMVNYTDNQPTRTEQDLVDLRGRAAAVNLWPEGSLQNASYWVPDSLLTPYGDMIRQHWTFKPEYRQWVDRFKADLRRAHDKEVVFIGMHIRRTDYVQYSKQVLKKSVLGKTYFLEAVEYYQEEFPGKQVLFLAVSDDMQWVQRKLGSIAGLVLAGTALLPASELDGLDPVGLDLCLLASVDHSVISQGLFGLWGAFLAGGDTYSGYGPLIRSSMHV